MGPCRRARVSLINVITHTRSLDIYSVHTMLMIYLCCTHSPSSWYTSSIEVSFPFQVTAPFTLLTWFPKLIGLGRTLLLFPVCQVLSWILLKCFSFSCSFTSKLIKYSYSKLYRRTTWQSLVQSPLFRKAIDHMVTLDVLNKWTPTEESGIHLNLLHQESLEVG